MDRSVGIVEAIRVFVPDSFASAFAFVTLLGDAGVLLAIAVAYYWYTAGSPASGARKGLALDSDRRRSAFVIACALGALSLTTGLKAAFALPRPPAALGSRTFVAFPFADLVRSVVESAANASGYGFPSGHAIGSTAVYGALALVAGVGTRRERWAVAGLSIGLVSLSRVVLGVHYLIDVLVGIAVGLAFLVGMSRGGVDAGRAFAVAVLLGGFAVIASVGDMPRDAVTLLGISVGAGGAWALIVDSRRSASRDEHGQWGEQSERVGRLEVVLTGTVVTGVPGALVYALDFALPIAFAGGVAVGAAAITTPRIATVGTRVLRVIRSDQNVSK